MLQQMRSSFQKCDQEMMSDKQQNAQSFDPLIQLYLVREMGEQNAQSFNHNPSYNWTFLVPSLSNVNVSIHIS